MILIHCDGLGCKNTEPVEPGHRQQFIAVKELLNPESHHTERHFCSTACLVGLMERYAAMGEPISRSNRSTVNG